MKVLFTLAVICLQLGVLKTLVNEDEDFDIKVNNDKFTLPDEEKKELAKEEGALHQSKRSHIRNHIGEKRKNIPFAPEVTADDIKRQSLEHPIVHAYVSDRPKNTKPHKKTVIPAGKNLVYDIHDGPNDGYAELDHDVSKRFELYPKWFSHKIPRLFGKHFAKRYYHPFGTVSNRDQIARSKVKTATGSKRNYHMLPASWMHSPQLGNYHHNHITINESPKEFMEMQPGRIAPVGPPRGPSLNLANAVGEIVDIPDNNGDNAENNNIDDHLDDDLREIPHTLMHHLNPDEYAPAYANHPDDHWLDYGALPHGHHHRHPENPCLHAPCLNGGSCHFLHSVPVYHFKCNCRHGFSGHYCEHTPFSCHPNPCQHDGICTKTTTGFFCSCPQDYKGHNCQIQSACLQNPCLNNGACTETADGFICQCEKGFTGQNCNEKVSLCAANPCANGGTCKELEDEGRFECTCPSGFGCVDCTCPVAITSSTPAAIVVPGVAPATSLTVATGAVCPDNACKNGGTCVKSYSGFSCNCPPGFHGMDCSTPDLCTPNPCENAGVCVQDGDENYKCVCPYGFKGADCQTPLACSSHPCMNGATCMETPDGFHCKCATGYKGKKCTDLSPCSRNPCMHKATCLEKGSLYTCTCKIGYRGKSCRDKDPCVPNPCGGNGMCAEVNGITTCNCTRGWMGEMCEIENQCQANRCLNGATCVHTLEEFKCVCPEGFHGTNCEFRSPCHTSPCENGGICEASGSTFVCRCGAGFHGERCHLSSHCHPNPCHNGGRCFDGDEDYICECPHAFTGRLCEERHSCMSEPCMNGGHCMEMDDAYHCKCRLGYFGRDCSDYVCEQNPCRNGGTCMPANTEIGFACECVFPYHGHRCDEVDPCIPNPCKNAGTCHSHLQRVRDVNYHLGPVFHGTDENVVSVVGPIHNETVHHAPYYDEASHAVSYLPDAQLQTNEVNHFHLTSDTPSKVYDDQLYHARTEDDDDNIGHSGHIIDPHKKHESANHYHVEQYPDDGGHSIRRSHRPIDEEEAERRTFKVPRHHHLIVSEVDGILKRRSRIKRKHILNLHRRHKIIDAVPKVTINVRNKATSELIKRTIHDLYVCQCSDGYLGAHCQRMS
ncbi:fibropellin-1-like [Hydractinia symbiolongicarpus]|uniref:fibropellin-1-like n=1 Tax=Hydractinia symbiolongicarpus TaxID=13093 RepID=UPI00254B82A8|nr:fibropellin-1-like [Hydractinia symbiolongicarpus]